MKKSDSHIIDSFFALVRAGLWEKDIQISQLGSLDFVALKKLAVEQTVLGLVTAGLDHVVGCKITKSDAVPFLKEVVAIEAKNSSVNHFIVKLVDKLRSEAIAFVLVKGQGVAQCYERPSWRSIGDVDLFFDQEGYNKAQSVLGPIASKVGQEDKIKKHIPMTIDSWIVELHGALHSNVSEDLNNGVDAIQRDIFENGGTRIWNNDGVEVPLPSPDNDAVLIFTHFLGHFYVGGIGLRQICDWCRLLWTYRETIDRSLLRKRLENMGVISEWEAFATFAVSYLGMPEEAMPFYVDSPALKRKARRIRDLILETGNFGHNKDDSYHRRYSGMSRNLMVVLHRFIEFVRLSTVFPKNAPRFFMTYISRKKRAAMM